TPATYARLVYAEQGREATIGESFALQRAHSIAIEARQAVRLQLLLLEHEILNLDEEPRVDAAKRIHLIERQAGAECIGHIADAVRPGHAQLFSQELLLFVCRRQVDDRIEPVDARLETAQRLLQRLLESAPHRHDFADRLHLRRQTIVGAGK